MSITIPPAARGTPPVGALTLLSSVILTRIASVVILDTTLARSEINFASGKVGSTRAP